VSSDSLGSDRYPILISIDEPPVKEEVDVTKYAFRKTDWDRFKSHCKSLSLESVSNENLELYYSNMLETLTVLMSRQGEGMEEVVVIVEDDPNI